jgi:hypothetical protein
MGAYTMSTIIEVFYVQRITFSLNYVRVPVDNHHIYSCYIILAQYYDSILFLLYLTLALYYDSGIRLNHVLL